MSSRIRSRSLCSRLSRQGFPCSWCGLGAVLLFVMAYPPVAETSTEEIPVLFSTTSQEHTPFTFLQESGQNRIVHLLNLAHQVVHIVDLGGVRINLPRQPVQRVVHVGDRLALAIRLDCQIIVRIV